MSNESPAARGGQNARQLLLFGRLISNDELMERLDAISPKRIQDLAGRLFLETVPTIAAVGPIDAVPQPSGIGSAIETRLDGFLQICSFA